MEIRVKDKSVAIHFATNKTDEESQYNDIIGETDKYIVSLIKNTDAYGNLLWIEIMLTEKEGIT